MLMRDTDKKKYRGGRSPLTFFTIIASKSRGLPFSDVKLPVVRGE